MDDLSGEFILNEKSSSATQKSASRNVPKQPVSTHRKPNDIAQKNLHFYSSLNLDPEGVTVLNQAPDEQVHILIRRHLITNLPWLCLVVVLFFLPIFIPWILTFLPSVFQISPSTLISFLGLYYLAVFGYSLLKFSEWYFQVGLITNKRLIDVDMANILSKNIAETQTQSVEDVTFTQKGVLQSLFNFGNVVIQTEALEQNFEFERVPHPSQVAEIINELAEQSQEGRSE